MIDNESHVKYGYDAVTKISDKAFKCFKELIHQKAGIHMTEAKKVLIAGRLRKRLNQLHFNDYLEYYDYILSDEGIKTGELQFCIDKLTTNETYFFREPQHFDFLIQKVLPNLKTRNNLKIWCAASSTGEEPYTLAMILAKHLGIEKNWKIWATDISTKVLKAAKIGIYKETRAEHVSQEYRHKYLLNGVRAQSDCVCVVPELREKVKYSNYNLIESPLPSETFDIIFCRNVLIYFDAETKIKVVNRLLQRLDDSGLFFSGRSESLHVMSDVLQSVFPSVYVKKNGTKRSIYLNGG